MHLGSFTTAEEAALAYAKATSARLSSNDLLATEPYRLLSGTKGSLSVSEGGGRQTRDAEKRVHQAQRGSGHESQQETPTEAFGNGDEPSGMFGREALGSGSQGLGSPAPFLASSEACVE